MFLVVLSTLISLLSPGHAVEVLTVVDESLDTRVTVLQEPITTTVTQSSLSLNSDSSSSVSLPHRRRRIKDSTVEGILLGSTYILAFENSTFLNFSLPCPPYELYDPVGLESSVVQIITCVGVSDVLVVTKKNEQYSVVLRISSDYDMSSAAIVTRNGASTAIYYSEENGLGSLMYYPLTKSALNDAVLKFLSPGSGGPTCLTGWEVSSYSDNRVALFCSTSNKLFLKNGIDKSLTEVQVSFENPSSVVFVRNKGIAIDITSVGVKIYSNDFNDFVPIPTPLPVRKVDYGLVNGTLYIFMFTSDGKSIYLLNDSKSFNEDFLETLVEETDPTSSISLNSTYISTSGTLAYTVMRHNSWAVKVIDYINSSKYPTVYHPWNPVLVDIRRQSVSTTTPDHELTTELASTQTSSLIASSPTGTLSTETSSSLSTKMSSSLSTESPHSTPTETSSVNPAIAVGVEKNGRVIGSIIAGVSVAVIIVVIIIIVIIVALLCIRRSKRRRPQLATDSYVSVATTCTVPKQESSPTDSMCSDQDLPIQESSGSFGQQINLEAGKQI